ncbi:hypothetical protein [Bacillus sp. L75]|uniref:hypothetical protein n=1 Tax=Bacillus sp. L75 TaxID=1267944 RepID=UPI000F2DA1C2|nr:hypothetical protein [Bacillus sp. L75]RKW72015.1 hypothetical protein D5S11_19660 [Bacillus sp. L75]
MIKDNLTIVENDDLIAIFCNDQNIDISGLDRSEKAVIVVYKKPCTYVNARKIKAKGFLCARRLDDGALSVLTCKGLIKGTIENWFASAEKLIGIIATDCKVSNKESYGITASN